MHSNIMQSTHLPLQLLYSSTFHTRSEIIHLEPLHSDDSDSSSAVNFDDFMHIKKTIQDYCALKATIVQNLRIKEEENCLLNQEMSRKSSHYL